MADDCSSPGAVIKFAPTEIFWRESSGTRLDSEAAHNFYSSQCSSDARNNPHLNVKKFINTNRLKNTTSESSNTLILSGSILIPNSFPSPNSNILVGLKKNSDNLSDRLGVSIQNSKWGITSILNGKTTQYPSSKLVSKNKDLTFEFKFQKNSNLTLSIGGEKVLETPLALSWPFMDKPPQLFINSSEGLSNIDKSLLTQASPNSGSGIFYEMLPTNRLKQYAIHGWIYIPSSNDLTNSKVALAGFARYGADQLNPGGSAWANVLALGIINGKWALFERQGGDPLEDNIFPETVSTNTWNEFELFVSKDKLVSLMLNRTWLIEDKELDADIDWFYDDYSGGQGSIVIGILDNLGPNSLKVFTDDTDILSASAWTCKGWSPESCPFK